MAIGYLDAPPALEWREHYEQIGRPVAPVFVIMPGGLSWFRRDRHARFGNELLGRLVDADQGTFRIIRPLINVQDVLHGGHEGGAGVRGNDPLLSQMRLESVFFSVRPIVLSLARLTIFSSTTAFPAVAMSSVPGRPAAWNRPTRSTWPRPPRRRCAASLNLVNACESGRPRTLLRPAAGASSRPCRHCSPGPPRSGCRSSSHHPPRRRLSTGSCASAAFVLDGVRYG